MGEFLKFTQWKEHKNYLFEFYIYANQIRRISDGAIFRSGYFYDCRGFIDGVSFYCGELDMINVKVCYFSEIEKETKYHIVSVNDLYPIILK